MKKEISLFSGPIQNTTPLKSVDLDYIADLIQNSERLESLTKEMRDLTDHKKFSAFKNSKLPYVTFSGVFSQRSDTELGQHSGYICIDIDDIELSEYDKENIMPFEGVKMIFNSPSGSGYKIIFKVDMYDVQTLDLIKDLHYCYVQYLVQFFNKYLTMIGHSNFKVDNLSDMSRACYLCHDPNIFHFKLSTTVLSVPLHELRTYSKPEQKVKEPVTKETIKKVERACDWLHENDMDITYGYENWVKLGLSLASLGERGRQYFQSISQRSNQYDYNQTNEKFTDLLKSGNGLISIGTFLNFVWEARNRLNVNANN